ncbi:MAG: hypothetical protein ACJAYU_004999 [Bradymonadia bacterium]|jgi:hypothetical protein
MLTLRQTFFSLFTLLLMLSSAGCGSVLSSAEINTADTLMDEALSVSAEQLAVYEYVSAEEYLNKAREEWGRSDFQQAVDYARRAQEFATMAYERALRVANFGASPEGVQ